MFVNNEIKKQLEKLSSEEDNKKCFDCEAEPARWTSLNNAIFLCHECSEEHKSIESSGNNVIKSITLEQWTKSQLNLMKAGGNKRLKLFLQEYNVPNNISKKALYNSKLMVYYRKLIKSEAESELLLDQIPPKEEYWESYLDENNQESNNNENIAVYDNNNNDNQFVDGHLIDYPKSSIKIDEEHYIIAKEKKILEDKYENSILKKDSFSNEDKDDPKYSSVSSNDNNNVENNSSMFQNSGYFGTIGNIVSTVKDKINEYTIGKGIMYLGEKVYDGVVFIGGKIIETGSDLIHSQTAQNIVHKAGEGLRYIAYKITGNNSNDNNENSNNYTDINDENNRNRNNDNNINFNMADYENNYGVLNDQNENLLV
jgi:hypothetical protein